MLLKRYIRLLTVLFGAGCSHLTEVQGIYQVLAEKMAVYEVMSGELIAETLWQVFLEARECFTSAIWDRVCPSPSCSRCGTISAAVQSR